MAGSTDKFAVPEWLNVKFIEDVLSKYNSDLKVANIKVTSAAQKGDHYASVMYRVIVDHVSEASTESGRTSLVLKTLPHQNCTKKKLLEGMFIFKTEIRMYSETVPKFEELLQKAGDVVKLGARTMYHSLEPQQLIVFEDLTEKGYDLIRDRRLTKQETKNVLVQVAKWHAASYVLHKQGDKTISQYSQSLFSMTDLINSSFLSDGINGFMKMLERTEDLKMYCKHFDALRTSLIAKCVASTQTYFTNSEGLFVLNHGDLHIKNLMFKLKGGQDMSDIKLVDFQLSFFGPAAYDIILLLYGIADTQTRIYHRDEIIYVYFEYFAGNLRKMGLSRDLPKLADLKIDMLRHRHLEVYFFTTFMPMIIAGENLKSEMDSTAAVENADYRGNFYYDKVFVDEARIVLPMFLQQGYLD